MSRFNLLRNISSKLTARFYSDCSPCPPCPHPKTVVTLLDMSCPVGENLALLLMQSPYIAELRLFDDRKETCGVAVDLSHIDTRVKVLSFKKNLIKEAIMGAGVVVCAGGCQHKPMQSPGEVFENNANHVRNCALHMAEFNPEAVFCIAKPPVEALVPMVSEDYKRAGTYDPRKIIGITSFQSMISNHLIAQLSCTDPSKISTPVIGGVSPGSLVPVASRSKPDISSDAYFCVVSKFDKAEEEVVKLKMTDCNENRMLSLSRSLSIANFVNTLLKALQTGIFMTECGFVRQIGHIEKFLPYMTSVVRLGSDGIHSTHMPKLSKDEENRLKGAVPKILDYIKQGEVFSNGDFQEDARTCDRVVKQKLADLEKLIGQSARCV